MWCVYLHTFPNGKVYVGVTSRTPNRRWGLNGQGYCNNRYMWNAINKYGWENVEHTILLNGLNREEASQAEQYFIAKYDATNRKKGYNFTTGGVHYEFSEDVKAKMRGPKNLSDEARNVFRENGKRNYEKYLKGRRQTPEEIKKMSETKRGVKQSEEVRKKRGEALKNKWAQQGGLSEEHKQKLRQASTGRKHSEEAIEKMRAAKSPEKNPRSRRVLQLSDGVVIGEYCSTREAMRETGINYASIVRVCNGVRLHQAGGYQWKYAEA